MSKYMTSVFLFVSAVLAIGPNTFAADPGTSQSNQSVSLGAMADTSIQFCDKIYKNKDDELRKGKTEAEYEKCLREERKKYLDAAGQNNPIDKQNCENQRKSYVETQKELRDSCKTTGATKSVQVCFNEIKGCKEVEGENQEAMVGSNGNLYFDSDTGCEMLQACPALAASQMKDWKKTVNEGEDKVTKYSNDKLDAEKEQAELTSRNAKELQRIQKEIQDISNSEQEILQKLPEQLANLDLQTRNQINQLREQASKLEFEMDRAEFAQNQAVTDYQNMIGGIEAKCKSEARAKFDAASASSSGNVGGFNALVSNQSRANRVLDRVINYECTQPSVVEARAAAQREMNRKMGEAQVAYGKYRKMMDQQKDSFQDLYRQFEQQKIVASNANKSALTRMSSRKTQLMTELATITDEMQRKGNIAQQKSALAEQNLQRLQQNIAMSNSSLKCTKGMTASEEANANAMGEFGSEFNNTAEAYCKAEVACVEFGGVPGDFLTQVKDPDFQTALKTSGGCNDLYDEKKGDRLPADELKKKIAAKKSK